MANKLVQMTTGTDGSFSFLVMVR